MRNKLFNLLASNAKRGSFKAEGNTIFVYDMIVSDEMEAEFFGGVSATAFAKTLKGMSGPISLRINSPGGDVFAARAMAAAMKEYAGGEITAYVDGYAASAASVLAVSADRCVMADGSFMMIHNAWTFSVGNAEDHLSTAALLEKIDASLAATYAAKTGKDAAVFADLMAAETWFNAEEAVANGLADEMAVETPKAAAKNKATAPLWNLAAFDKAPQGASTCTTTTHVERTITETIDSVTVEVEDDVEDAAEETAAAASEDMGQDDDISTAAMAADETAKRIRLHATRMALATA